MKRFTETQKWEDPWFRKLTPELKLLWQWLLDRCDNAGVIEPDIDLASFQIGVQYSIECLSEFGERIQMIARGKWFITKFIEFQYGTLSEECRAHRPIFLSLEKHQINGYLKGINTLQEKEKEKEKEEETISAPKARGTVDEFRGYAVQIGLEANDGDHLHAHLSEVGWKRGNAPIKDWKATMRKWKHGGWLPSQKAPKAETPKKLVFFDPEP